MLIFGLPPEVGDVVVDVPVDQPCLWCDEAIVASDRGFFQCVVTSPKDSYLSPIHQECSLRAVMGGWGHLVDHQKWCIEHRDPDGGFSRRTSAKLVWDYHTLSAKKIFGPSD